MSFPALALAVDAAYVMPPLEDDEFGLTWSDFPDHPVIDVTWALYRSAGAGLILGVKSTHTPTLDEFLETPMPLPPPAVVRSYGGGITCP